MMPDGSISGNAESYRHGPSGNSEIHSDVVCCVPVGDELFVLSRITQVVNAPGIAIGSWALFAIQDNGNGAASPDKVISDTGNIPGFVPIETIQQILLLPPPMGPPTPDQWFTLVGGDFTIH